MTNIYILSLILASLKDGNKMAYTYEGPVDYETEFDDESYQAGYEDGIASCFHILADILTEIVLEKAKEYDDEDEEL